MVVLGFRDEKMDDADSDTNDVLIEQFIQLTQQDLVEGLSNEKLTELLDKLNIVGFVQMLGVLSEQLWIRVEDKDAG